MVPQMEFKDINAMIAIRDFAQKEDL